MNNINISVVIPHYNIPKLLIRCINSIPIRKDIQVIVVDDCSPNAETYKFQYPELSRPNLEFYNTNKGGSAGRARNIGIEHAKGKWLFFIDADDILPNDIESIFNELLCREEDLIIMDYRTVFSDDLSSISSRNPMYHKRLYQYFEDHNESNIRYKYDPMWGKLVKTELVKKNNILFDCTRWNNDSYFSTCVGIFAKNIYASKRIGYILTERRNSLTSNFCKTIEEMATRLEVHLRIKKLFKKHNVPTCNSYVYFFDDLAHKNFDYSQRLLIAIRLWRYPRYALHLLKP